MSNAGARSKGGRPPKLRGPKVPYDEVDRLLVEGEIVEGPDGVEVRVWPTQRDVAKRYGVSPGLIGSYAKQMNAQARRDAFQAGKPLPPRTLADAPPVEEPSSSEASEEPNPEQPKRRRPGRPRKSEAPVISLEELDRLLVFGEVVQTPDGAATTRFPTYRELADRYGVAVSYVAAYVKSHNCLRRRDEAKTRLALRVEDKLIEKRAEAIAVGKDDVVRLIDEFLLGFEKALKEGRVRSDNPTDVNTFVRLKEFILGGADSRQELRAALSLESIQQRYARMLQDRRDDPALTGMVDGSTSRTTPAVLVESNGVEVVPISDPCSVVSEPLSPRPSSDAPAEKPHESEDLTPDDEVPE
jgi:hypothetical protein